MIKIEQIDVDKYVANGLDFIKEFSLGIQAPYHPWHEVGIKVLLKKIVSDGFSWIFSYAILKGEYPVVWDATSKMFLTNYRLLFNDGRKHLNIPLKNIQEFNATGCLKYSVNNKVFTEQFSYIIDDGIVNSVITRAEYDGLDEKQSFILNQTIYDLNKINSTLVIPTISENDLRNKDILSSLPKNTHKKDIKLILRRINEHPKGWEIFSKLGCFSLIFIFIVSIFIRSSCNCGNDITTKDPNNPNSTTEQKPQPVNPETVLINCDWVYPNMAHATGAWKFSSDHTFNFSTTAFGGMTRNGRWSFLSENRYSLVYDNGDSKTITVESGNSFLVGSTRYAKY